MWGAFRATRPVLDGRIRFTKPHRLTQSAKANRRTVTARMQANAHVIREGQAALAATKTVARTTAHEGAGGGVMGAAGATTAAAAFAVAAAREAAVHGGTGVAQVPADSVGAAAS